MTIEEAKLQLRLERKSLVLALRFAGGTKAEIAKALGIAGSTIDYYIQSDARFNAAWKAINK